jgi:hypothetical protein
MESELPYINSSVVRPFTQGTKTSQPLNFLEGY